jgi:hypothetical protein
MSISGGVKFFERPVSLFSDGNIEVTASTGGGAASRALDRNRVTYWRSVGSDDTTTETITLTFTAPVTFNRIFLLDHNFQGFNVQYDLSSVWTHFTSVVGLDGSQSNVTETAFSEDSAYYEHASVTTTGVRIQVTTTQVADEDKYLNQLVLTNELGTLVGYPDITGIEFSRNERSKKMLSGRTLSLKGEETFKVNLAFKNYPPSLSADIDLAMSLFDMEETFLVWLCGGRRGTDYFKKTLRGWRLRDLFSVQTAGGVAPDYTSNSYVLPVNLKINLVESVD